MCFMDRRGFIGSVLALCAAPAVVRAGSLMRVSPLVVPQWNYTEIVRRTIAARGPELSENVVANNALIDLMEARIRAASAQLAMAIDVDIYRMAA